MAQTNRLKGITPFETFEKPDKNTIRRAKSDARELEEAKLDIRRKKKEENSSKINLLAEDSMRNDDYLAPERTGKKRKIPQGKFGDTKESLKGLLRK